MRSSLQTRRQSLLPVLALLGVTLSLSPAPKALAIGGGAASASAPTSPRESGGAAPSVSLFQTSASSYTGGGSSGSNTSSSEVTSSGTSTGSGGGGERVASRGGRTAASSTEERGESAGRQRATRRREREGGGTTASSGGRQSGRVVASDGKGTVDNSKGGKQPVVVPPPAPPIFTLSGGYQTRYMYHGLDIISFNSRYRNNLTRNASGQDQNFTTRAESSGIYFTDASVEYKGLRAGVNYVQAVDPTVPYFYKSEPGRANALPGDRVSLYRELDVHLDYTLSIVPNWLDATVGYNSFFFLNGDFKGTNYQGEVPIKLTFTRIPYIRPSFSFFRYISDYKDFGAGNLNGNYVEFRLDSGIPIVDRPNFGLSIAPYAVVSYNINYLKFAGDYDIGGWNTFETGVKLPVRVGKHFTITPFGNYGQNLSGARTVPNNFAASNLDSSSGSRSFGESTRFWGGVNLAYTF